MANRNGKDASKKSNPVKEDLTKEQIESIRKSMEEYSRKRLKYDRKEAERVGRLTVEVLTQ